MGLQPDPGYRLEIRTGSGDGPTFTSLTGLAVNRRHTEVPDWSATVPNAPGPFVSANTAKTGLGTGNRAVVRTTLIESMVTTVVLANLGVEAPS